MTTPNFHASADGSPFGSALCGYKPEGEEGVWITQIATDVSCVVCLAMTTT
jgi:hypothetical protein